jgi:hypothetical protein
MKQTKKSASLILAVCLVMSFLFFTVLAVKAATNKTVKNLIVKSTNDSKKEIKAVKGGSTYTIDATSAKIRKASTGSKSMTFSKLTKGDVINVTGSFDSHDVTATTVRDLSATKSATFYGVVESINTATQTVKIKTLKRGKITVAVIKSTKVTYDDKKRTFTDIREDDKVLVRGTWNSSKKTITKTKNFDILVKDDYDALD